MSHDLGRALAAHLGVVFEPIVYRNPEAYLTAGLAGNWDVGSLGVDPERRAHFDFAPPHLEVDYGYLVSADARIESAEDVDRPGVRVGLVSRSASGSAIAKSLKHASIVHGRDLSELIDLVQLGDADVIAAQKTNLISIAPRLPGSHVLGGRPGAEQQALAVPKGRDGAGLEYLRAFVEHAKSQGLVDQAIERAGIRGAVVPR